MKEEFYKCDRCGKKILKDGYSIEHQFFGTVMQTKHKIRFFAKWKEDSPMFIQYELCKKCREDLDAWLEVYAH